MGNPHYCAMCSRDTDHSTRDCPQLQSTRDEIAAAQAALLGCPFCGGRATIHAAVFHGIPRSVLAGDRSSFCTGCWVSCDDLECGVVIGRSEAYDDCEGGSFDSGKEAALFWNRRP